MYQGHIAAVVNYGSDNAKVGIQFAGCESIPIIPTVFAIYPHPGLGEKLFLNKYAKKEKMNKL